MSGMWLKPLWVQFLCDSVCVRPIFKEKCSRIITYLVMLSVVSNHSYDLLNFIAKYQTCLDFVFFRFLLLKYSDLSLLMATLQLQPQSCSWKNEKSKRILWHFVKKYCCALSHHLGRVRTPFSKEKPVFSVVVFRNVEILCSFNWLKK